jgi:hypothetical protein
VDGEVDGRRGVRLGQPRPDRGVVAVREHAQLGAAELGDLGQIDPAADVIGVRAGQREVPESRLQHEPPRERRGARERVRLFLGRRGLGHRHLAQLRRLVGAGERPSASAIGLPSCSIRAETVVMRRPARAISVVTRTGPTAGGRRN